MTPGWIYKFVQAGIIGLMVYIIIKVFADRFRKQKEERIGKKPKPFLEEMKGKLCKRREGIYRDADYVETKNDMPNKELPTSGDDGVPQEEK